MSWFSAKLEKFKQMSNSYLILPVAAKFLFGVGLGLLLAFWLPVWIGWIFIIVSLVIAIPSTRFILGK